MVGEPNDFWGKLHRPNDGVPVEWHPLVDHCADVAATARALLDQQTWRLRLAKLGSVPVLEPIVCDRLAVLAALHDIGKFNVGFQSKGRAGLGPPAGHVREGVWALTPKILPSLAPLAAWGLGTEGLLHSSVCHHGRPYSVRGAGAVDPLLWRCQEGLDPSAGVEQLVERCRGWFPAAFGDSHSALPDNEQFENAFAGLVMLADWIGSDRRIFEYSEPGSGDRMKWSRNRLSQFFDEGWLAVNEQRRGDRARESPFRRVAPKRSPRAMQTAVIDLPIGREGSITVLESETGSGKTEAALGRFARLFSAGLVDGLYFALPTRTAAMQIYRRVLEAAASAFTAPPPVTLAVPGYLSVDGVAGIRLPEFRVKWEDEESDRSRDRRWAGEFAKRYLAGCIVVGTIDQVLLSALRVRHSHLRATALLRQFLVVDEVHASDAYMARLLESVLARHYRAGGHALLLSATLGGESRARLMAAGQRNAPVPLDDCLNARYPLISHRASAFEHSEVSAVTDQDDRLIDLEAMPWLENHERGATTALDAARQGAAVLVVKNTVADCILTQHCLEKLATQPGDVDLLFSIAGVAAPHHSRFSRADRELLDAELELRFGPSRVGHGCVVIATQTVQQSLDIDADLLISDLCPADVLLQRVGRLHRHRRVRPAGFVSPRAMVLVPADRDLGGLLGDAGKPRNHHGLGTVYDDLRVLEATWRLIETDRRWRIPEMCRRIVEHSVHSAVLWELCADRDARWQAHREQMEGLRRGSARRAELNLVDWQQRYSEMDFADDERIPTRLGGDDRRVRFDPAFMGPFGAAVNELSIRDTWLRGVSAELEVAKVVDASGDMTEFTFGDKHFLYNRHGLQRAPAQSGENGNDDSQ